MKKYKALENLDDIRKNSDIDTYLICINMYVISIKNLSI